MAQLNFQAPDFERFVCLRLAYNALRLGGSAPAILNAANEVAVDAFLNEKIAFTQIARLVEQTMERLTVHNVNTMDVVLSADQQARITANELLLS